MAANPELAVYLRADRDTRYEVLARIMADARRAGGREDGFCLATGGELMSITPDPNGPLVGPARTTKAAPAEGIPSTRSDVLLGQARQLRIEHAGEWYVLRQTTNNKLILTK